MKQQERNMPKRKRQDLTAVEKLEIFKKFKDLPACSLREGAEKLGVSRTLLTNILKNEEKLKI